MLAGLIPLAPLAFAACKGGAAAESEPAGGRGGRGGRRAGGEGGLTFAVDTMVVELKKLDYIVTAPGTVEAFERVQVTARVAGVVDKINFREGQDVKAGDPLVVIDSARFQLAVNSAKAALAKTEAAQKDTEAQVARREGASDSHPGLIPGEELSSYRTKALTAKADTAVALENVKIAELNLRDAYVRAPIAGTIQTRTVETGQYVNTGYVMATLLRQDPLLLRFNVEPQEAPRLKPGMEARFTMRETQRSFTAKLTLVNGAADPVTHMVGVTGQIEAEEHKYWLRPGSFCDVAVDIGASREAPVIPRSATRATDHGYVVWTVNDDIVEERVITIGMSSKDGWIEVRSGLKGGESIVVRGGDSVQNGSRVRATRVTSIDGGALEAVDEGDAGAAGDGGRRMRGDGGRGGKGRREAGAGEAPQ